MQPKKTLTLKPLIWSVARPALYDLLKELEFTGDETGFIIWRKNQPYALISAYILNPDYKTLKDIKLLAWSDIIDIQIENNPFNTLDMLSHALWGCGMKQDDYEKVLSWILQTFPKVATKHKKWKEKYHL